MTSTRRDAVGNAVDYIDRTIRDSTIVAEMAWTTPEVCALLTHIRDYLDPHTKPHQIEQANSLDAARAALENTLMRYGLGGTITEWVAIHSALDAYADTIRTHLQAPASTALAEGTGS